MSKIPKGAAPLLFVFEEASGRGGSWRSISEMLDQRQAIELMDWTVTSYPRRVVQVVAVRLPAGPPTDAELRELAARQNPGPRGLGEFSPDYGDVIVGPDPLPLACAMQGCEAPTAPGSRWCSGHSAGLPSNARREGEYGPDRYAEDFPRPRGVTP
jgi:hypothetical protein